MKRKSLATALAFAFAIFAVFSAAAPVRAALDTPACITQGQLALAIAQLIWGAQAPETEAAAINALKDPKVGIEPAGGWNPEACADAVRGELELLVGQAIAAGRLAAENAGVVAEGYQAIEDARSILSGSGGGGGALKDSKRSASPFKP